MKIFSVYDKEFKSYGQVLDGYELSELLETLEKTTEVTDKVEYTPDWPSLSSLPIAKELSDRAYGGMPIQMGWCNGYNTKLNCLEYHCDSELNLGTCDFILLLALRSDIENGRINSSDVKAFKVPAGVLVEVYATSLHYAPCAAKSGERYRVLIVLPKGTNTEKPDIVPKNDEDTLMTARNKWLLAHPESSEAANGAAARIDGENIDIADLI